MCRRRVCRLAPDLPAQWLSDANEMFWAIGLAAWSRTHLCAVLHAQLAVSAGTLYLQARDCVCYAEPRGLHRAASARTKHCSAAQPAHRPTSMHRPAAHVPEARCTTRSCRVSSMENGNGPNCTATAGSFAWVSLMTNCGRRRSSEVLAALCSMYSANDCH